MPLPVCLLSTLQTLLLGHNHLFTALPHTLPAACCWAGEAPGERPGEGSAAPYLERLEQLGLEHNPTVPLPLAAVAHCSALRLLDLRGSARQARAEEWQQLAAALPPACICMRLAAQPGPPGPEQLGGAEKAGEEVGELELGALLALSAGDG